MLFIMEYEMSTTHDTYYIFDLISIYLLFSTFKHTLLYSTLVKKLCANILLLEIHFITHCQ